MTIAEIFSSVNYARIEVGNRWLTGGTGKAFKVLEERKSRPNKLKRDYRGKLVVQTTNEARAVYELLKGEPKLYADAIKRAKADLKKKPTFKGYKVLAPNGIVISIEEYLKYKDYNDRLEDRINTFLTGERTKELLALLEKPTASRTKKKKHTP